MFDLERTSMKYFSKTGNKLDLSPFINNAMINQRLDLTYLKNSSQIDM